MREGLIERVVKDKKKAIAGIRRAKRDIKTALKNLSFDPEWAFTIAYHAVLRSGMALMDFEGYRARGKNQHKVVVEYCKGRLGKKFEELVRTFDRMRRKRHGFIYGIAAIAEIEAKSYIKEAQKIIRAIANKISKK